MNGVRAVRSWRIFKPGTTDKTPVMALIDYETREVRSRVIPDVDSATLAQAIAEHVDGTRTELWTDSAKPYLTVAKDMRSHQSVDHATGQYVKYVNGGRMTTNAVEGFFSQLKRSIDGTNHHVSRTHMPRYLDQFDFMYSYCKLTDSARMREVIGRAGGRRLTYKPLTGGNA